MTGEYIRLSGDLKGMRIGICLMLGRLRLTRIKICDTLTYPTWILYRFKRKKKIETCAQTELKMN
jgi:hypothetical protein